MKRQLLTFAIANILAGLSSAHAPLANAAGLLVPEGEPVMLAGKITVGQDKYASGHYTQIELLTPEVSPCNRKPIKQIMLWNADVGDSMILAPYVDKQVVVQGVINCPNSGIQFSPNPQRVGLVF